MVTAPHRGVAIHHFITCPSISPCCRRRRRHLVVSLAFCLTFLQEHAESAQIFLSLSVLFCPCCSVHVAHKTEEKQRKPNETTKVRDERAKKKFWFESSAELLFAEEKRDVRGFWLGSWRGREFGSTDGRTVVRFG